MRGKGGEEAARKSRWRGGGEEKGDREERVEEGRGGEGQTVVPRSGAEGDGR